MRLEVPGGPSGPRRECAVQRFCRRQKPWRRGGFAALSIQIPKGGGRLRRPEPKMKGNDLSFWKGRLKSIFWINGTVVGESPDGPSGPRRECAVQAFLPQAKTLAEGRLRRPEHSNTEGWRPPPAAGTQNKRQLLSQLPFVLVPVTGLEPVRCRQRWILSYSSHSEPNGLNRNKTVFSVTFQNIKNPKKPYKISIFDAKHQKYKQFVPSSIIGSQIPNLRRWRDVGGM